MMLAGIPLLTTFAVNFISMSYNKWFGTVIGGLAGGVVGAIIGFALGSMADNLSIQDRRSGNSDFDDFTRALLVLAAAVMKADGKVVRSERQYARQFLQKQFGEEKTEKLLEVLTNILDQEIPIQDVSRQIRTHMNYSGRLQLIHFLWGIAGSDGDYPLEETAIIEQIGSLLGISRADRESLKAMFTDDEETAYKILDVSPQVSDEEVKKAYRRMARKYHPERVEYLGVAVKNAATEKFNELNKAFEIIKKKRNVN